MQPSHHNFHKHQSFSKKHSVVSLNRTFSLSEPEISCLLDPKVEEEEENGSRTSRNQYPDLSMSMYEDASQYYRHGENSHEKGDGTRYDSLELETMDSLNPSNISSDKNSSTQVIDGTALGACPMPVSTISSTSNSKKKSNAFQAITTRAEVTSFV